MTKIFCIGYNKTGSTSLYNAISDLGFKGFDLREGEMLLKNVINESWSPIYSLCETAELFKDIPFSLPGVWRKLYNRYPNAKFILSERDSTVQWYHSIKKFHKKKFNFSDDPTWNDVKSAKYCYDGMLNDYLRFVFSLSDRPYNFMTLSESYENHNKEVKEFFKDSNNFLSVNVSNDNDYIKLCKFLGKEPIYSKFPISNKT